MIEAGQVLVSGLPAARPATLVSTADPIEVSGAAAPFASRGGLKLDGALRALSVEVRGRRWIDAGASTGGFTDRLLQGGASCVLAVDVGYGQLDWRLRNDDRVVVLERTNVRTLRAEDLPWLADGVVADLSFISLTKVMDRFWDLTGEDADVVCLVKPQFEVGRERVGKGGVVRDPALWRSALDGVEASAREAGFGLKAATVSDLIGPAGNVEFFIHLRKGHDSEVEAIERAVDAATRR